MKRRNVNEDQSERSSLSSKKGMQESREEPCEICGSVGIAGLIIVCFKCRDTREHTYCAKVFLPSVPPIWICEACRFSSRVLLIPSVADDQMDYETSFVDPKISLNSRVDDHETAILRTNDMEEVVEDQMDSETTVLDRSSDSKNDHETAKVRTIDIEEVVATSLIHPPLQPHTSPLVKETSSVFSDSSQNNEQHQPSQAFPKKRRTFQLMGKHITL